MNAYRRMAMVATTCAAGLSLAACSAGITTASTATSRSPATSRTASSPTASPSHSPSPSPADTVRVDAPIGSFPIPHEAQVLSNIPCGKQIIIELSSVTPSQASSFYMSELPRAGYKITGHTLTGTGNAPLPGSTAEIMFTGHGYKGTIAALSDIGALASMGPSPASVPSSVSKNFITISLTPPGTANTSAC